MTVCRDRAFFWNIAGRRKGAGPPCRSRSNKGVGGRGRAQRRDQTSRPVRTASQLEEEVAQSGFGCNVALGAVASKLLHERQPDGILRAKQVFPVDELRGYETTLR